MYTLIFHALSPSPSPISLFLPLLPPPFPSPSSPFLLPSSFHHAVTLVVPPIRVSTIVSAGTSKIIPRGGVRREGYEGVMSPERLDARSPVRLIIDAESHMETSER